MREQKGRPSLVHAFVLAALILADQAETNQRVVEKSDADRLRNRERSVRLSSAGELESDYTAGERSRR